MFEKIKLHAASFFLLNPLLTKETNCLHPHGRKLEVSIKYNRAKKCDCGFAGAFRGFLLTHMGCLLRFAALGMMTVQSSFFEKHPS